MRRFVCWVSLTFADFDLLVFSACGLTCAAQIAGTKHSPPTITTRRRQRIPNLDIPDSFPFESPDFLPLYMHHACHPASSQPNYCPFSVPPPLPPFLPS